METATFKVEVNFRPIENGEEPNWLGWYDNKENDFVLYAKNLEQMNDLLFPKNVGNLEKDGIGKLCKIIYERNGIKVNNKLL